MSSTIITVESMLDKRNFRLYLDRRRVDSISGETFSGDNPAKPKQVLGIFQKGNKEDVGKAVEAAEDRSYGLSSALYTRDIGKTFEAIAEIGAGLTYVNSSTIGSEVHLPFGGVKHSGIGAREAGIEGNTRVLRNKNRLHRLLWKTAKGSDRLGLKICLLKHQRR